MISGIDLNATVDYKLKNDGENPTIWKIGIIPIWVFLKLVQSNTDDRIKTSLEVLQLALKGWDNFDVPYEVVNEVFFGREMAVVPLNIIERIPCDCLFELAEKAIEINSISEKERKN